MGKALIPLLCVLISLSACAGKNRDYTNYPDKQPPKASQKPYTVNGRKYEPMSTHEGFVQNGVASWYGKDFDGKPTSSGERYDMYLMTAAHKTLPLGVYVKIYNKANGREAIVRVNDRGPFVKDRIIDLSLAAAKKLGVDGPGTASVRIEALGYRQDGGTDRYSQLSSYDAGNYSLQVGSFRDKANAERLSKLMRKQTGFSDLKLTDVKGERFYRVYAGKYSSLKAAQAGEKSFGDRGYPGSFVVSLD